MALHDGGGSPCIDENAVLDFVQGRLREAEVAGIDEHADGTLAIVDYKTSERATSGDWFGPRLRDAQVPLYASQSAETVRAAVVARLTPAEARYFGFWPDGAFPGRAAKAAHPDAAAQIALWRAQCFGAQQRREHAHELLRFELVQRR